MRIRNLIMVSILFVVFSGCANATFCNGCYYYIEDWSLPMDQNTTIWMIRVNDQLKYDDGVMDDSFSIGKSTDIHGRGHAIKFSPPYTPYNITNISVYGRYYCNNTQDYCNSLLEKQNFSIYILDSNLNYLGGSSYKYVDYFDTNWKWATIPIGNIQVNDDFYVFIDTNSSHPAEDWHSGITIGYDISNTQLSPSVSYVMDWSAAKPEIYPEVVSYTNPLHVNLEVYTAPDEVGFGLIDYQMIYDEGNSTILGIIVNGTGVTGLYSIDYYPGPWDTRFPVLDFNGIKIYATSLLNQSEKNYTFFRGYYRNSTTNWREAVLVVESPFLKIKGVYIIETGEFLDPVGEFIPQAAKFLGGYGEKDPVWVNLTNCSLESLKVRWTTASNGTYIAYAKAELKGDAVYFTKQIKVENKDLKPPVANFTFHPPNPVVGENVTFDASGSYDPDGYIVSYEWDFGEAYVAESSEPFINHTYYYPGTYTVWLRVTDNNGLTNSTSTQVEVTSAALANVTTSPQTVVISPDSSSTIDIVLDKVPTGLAYVNLGVSISNSTVAEITDIEFPTWATLTDNSTLPASTVWFKEGDLSDQVKAGDTNVVLATLTIKGLNPGTSNIVITINSFQDDNYQNIEDQIATISGTITVITGPPPIDDHQPMDLNGDGLFEDVNGNGQFNFGDVIFFFKNFDKDEIKSYPEFYDFNGDGSVNFGDVIALFKML